MDNEYNLPMTHNNPKAQRMATAYHEAGHAVARCLFRFPFRYVSIREGKDSLGHVYGNGLPKKYVLEQYESKTYSQYELENRKEVALAAPASAASASNPPFL